MALGYYFVEPNFYLVEAPTEEVEKLNNKFLKRGEIVRVPEKHKILGSYSYEQAWAWLIEINGRLELITTRAPVGKDKMLVAKIYH
jgi:hypothetical protein